MLRRTDIQCRSTPNHSLSSFRERSTIPPQRQGQLSPSAGPVGTKWTLALYLDNKHRLVGHAVVATGWVQAALLSARPILAGADACQASTCILIRYRRYGARSASESENRSFDAIAAACSRYGLAVSDHLVVVANGEYTTAFLGGP